MRCKSKTPMTSRPCSRAPATVLATIVTIALGAAATVSCGPPLPAPTEDAKIQTVPFNLELGEGSLVASVNYAVTHPNGFSKSGSVPVLTSTRVSFWVDAIPAGDGYQITITAESTDKEAMCSGTATFAVTAAMTTPVTVSLQCRKRRTTGSIDVNGKVNNCPVIDELSLPTETSVGGSLPITAVAHDADGKPSPLSYVLTAVSGNIDGAIGDPAGASFTCTSPGAGSVKLTAWDGDCADERTVPVTCTDICPPGWPNCSAAVLSTAQGCGKPVTAEQIPALLVCGSALGPAGADGFEAGDFASGWAAFDACVAAVIGCTTPATQTSEEPPLASSGICDQAGYQTCKVDAMNNFAIDMVKCGTVTALAALAGPITPLAAFVICSAGALAVENIRLRACVQTYTCHDPHVCVNNQCVAPPGIRVVSASYGAGSCGNPVGNVTGTVGQYCNGEPSCNFFVHNSVLGDPSYGCAKDFDVQFECNGQSGFSASHGAVAGEGYSVLLSCP
jgi:hypothetical protein